MAVIRNLLWMGGRLVTTAHWLPDFILLEEYTYWELATGFLLLSSSLFLAVRRGSSVLFWTVWSFAFVLPFLTSKILGNASGPSRYLYLSSVGTCFLFAWAIHSLTIHAQKRAKNASRALLAGILSIVLASSFLGLCRTEAVSLYQSGRTYFARGNKQLALKQFERAITRTHAVLPPDAYMRLAHAAFSLGKSVEPVLQSALASDPASRELSMLLGVSAFLYKDPQLRLAGKKRVERALKKSGDYLRMNTAVAFNNLASFYSDSADYQSAIEIYKKALRYNPASPSALFNLGNALYNIDELQKAGEAFKNVLGVQPAGNIEWMAARNLATVLTAQGLDEEAISYYKQATDVNPQDSSSYHSLAIALKQTGRFEEAIQAYNHYFRFEPDNWRAWLNLAQSYESLGRISGTIVAYKRAVSLNPDFMDAHFKLGIYYFRRGEFQQATESFRKAVQLSPDLLEARLGLAQSYEKILQYDQAIKQYRHALSLDPNNDVAKANLQALLEREQSR